MDPSLPAPSDDVDSAWPIYATMDSDDGLPSSAEISRPPQWVRTSSSSSSRSTLLSGFSATTSHMSSGQLSPVSTAMDIPIAAAAADADACLTAPSSLSSATTLDTSTSSSSPTLENSTSPSSQIGAANCCVHEHGHIDLDEALQNHTDHDNDMQWEASLGEPLAIPKLEPIDEDDFRLEDLQEAPTGFGGGVDTATPTRSKAKRSRGRPRKPSTIPATAPTGKITKGRSKTGCITCRKRKKKCDEAKPRCMNCEKNAVVCEGYPEKQIWKSGRERAEEELLKNQSLPVITMQPIFIGLETPEDRVFWKHYNDHLSAVFTVEGEHRNAFKDMLVPLATKHQGMMHSLLSLSSKHLDYDTPYGAKILRRTTKVTVDSLLHRGDFHNSKAVKTLLDAMGESQANNADSSVTLAARYGQMLCLVLESLAEGGISGSPRSHYEAFLYLIQNSPPQDPEFCAFIAEIFYYHIFADDLVYYPCLRTPRRLVSLDWQPITAIQAPRLIGVADGLFHYISQITTIRNRIRARMECNADPRVDYDSLYRASDIEGEILEWSPDWPVGDSRECVSLLYKQMTWLYLKTTICPPSSTPRPRGGPNANGPLRSNSASCVSSPSPKLQTMLSDDSQANNLRRHSIAIPNTASGSIRPFIQQPHDQQAKSDAVNGDLRASPPPIRRPANHEPGVTLAVEESLVLLESFKASDPAQTLLLIPCVIVGAACYAPAEQERVRKALRIIHGYTGLRNTGRALSVLEEVWRLMDLGEYLQAWDWQAVASRLGVDSLF